MKKLFFSFIIFLTVSNLYAEKLFEISPAKNVKIENLDKMHLITWKMKNTSGKALRIKKVESSCACAETQWPKVEILDGEEVEIHALLDTNQLKIGQFKKHVLVYLSGNKLLGLSFEGEVIRDIDFYPRGNAAHLKPVRPGNPWKFSTRIYVRADLKKDFKILDVQSTSAVDYSVETNGDRPELIISSKDLQKTGIIKEKLQVLYELGGNKFKRSYDLSGYCGNLFLTRDHLTRVKITDKRPLAFTKELDIQFPELIDTNSLTFVAKNGEKVKFNQSGKKVTLTITIPEKVIKHRHLGKFIIQGKDLVPLKLYYILEN